MRKHILKFLLLAIITILILISVVTPVTGTPEVSNDQPTVESNIPNEIEETTDISIPHILMAIAHCESGDIHFDQDGNVLRGRENPADIGRFQINEFYHGERARELGIDIYTWEGNTEFALLLYAEQGTKPWNWSKSCWSTS